MRKLMIPLALAALALPAAPASADRTPGPCGGYTCPATSTPPVTHSPTVAPTTVAPTKRPAGVDHTEAPTLPTTGRRGVGLAVGGVIAVVVGAVLVVVGRRRKAKRGE